MKLLDGVFLSWCLKSLKNIFLEGQADKAFRGHLSLELGGNEVWWDTAHLTCFGEFWSCKFSVLTVLLISACLLQYERRDFHLSCVG